MSYEQSFSMDRFKSISIILSWPMAKRSPFTVVLPGLMTKLNFFEGINSSEARNIERILQKLALTIENQDQEF